MSVPTLSEHSALTPSDGAGSLLPALGPETAVAVRNLAISPKKTRRPRAPKAPKDSKIYKAVLAYIALKAQGIKGPEIAETLGLTPHSLRQYVCYANKKTDWLKNGLDQPEDRLDIVLASKAVRNAETILDEKVPNTEVLTERAGTFAMEIMKGTGLLKTHQVSKTEGAGNTVFALKVEVVNTGGAGSPDSPTSAIALRPGSFGGAPAYDAEVIESEAL